MAPLNRLLNSAFDLLLRALQPLGIVASLAVLSLMTAIAILLVVRATSDQPALAAIKRQIQADLFEIRLFNDDLRAMLRAQLDILRHNATYLRLSLVPMMWILIPAILAAAQLHSYYGYTGVDVGRPVLVTAQFIQGSRPSAELDAPAALRIETPAIVLRALNQAVWRIVARCFFAVPCASRSNARLGVTRTLSPQIRQPSRRTAARPRPNPPYQRM
jgi:uncharacterized membrane protein (DUF106 family)